MYNQVIVIPGIGMILLDLYVYAQAFRLLRFKQCNVYRLLQAICMALCVYSNLIDPSSFIDDALFRKEHFDEKIIIYDSAICADIYILQKG